MNLPFKTGMIYKSETHPQFDMVIDFVSYVLDDDGKIQKYGTFVNWCNINKEKFSEFVDMKLGKDRANKSTFPYAFYGECSVEGIKNRIRKYNLKYVGMSDKVVEIYRDNEFEYCSGFKKGQW